LEKSDMEQLYSAQWYVEVQPPRPLAQLVACLWEIRIPTVAEKRVRILPNACIDIVIYASGTSQGEKSARIVAPPHRSFVVGSTLRSFIVRSAGCRHIVGASLLPAGVEPLLGVPARIIGDRIALLDDVIGSSAVEIEESILSATDHALVRVGHALVRLGRSRELHSVAARVVHRLRTAGGQKRIDALANEMNLSARQLERVFREHVGLGPKAYSRLVRFDRAARGIASRGTMAWTHFALSHGYTDQAHFLNEFKEFAGVTPAQFESELATGELRSR
jgi:AraC-like DNA-binding protein